MRMNGQKMTKLIFASRNFANVPKNTTRIVVWYRRSSTSVHYKLTPLLSFVREIWDQHTADQHSSYRRKAQSQPSEYSICVWSRPRYLCSHSNAYLFVHTTALLCLFVCQCFFIRTVVFIRLNNNVHLFLRAAAILTAVFLCEFYAHCSIYKYGCEMEDSKC